MAAELLDLFHSLAMILDEENGLLGHVERGAELAALVRAKSRLAAELAARIARLDRETPDWRETLDADTVASLTAASATLHASAEVNAGLLARRIALAEDVIGAIESDVRRRRGTSATGYGAAGVPVHKDLPNPIALNASL